MLRHVLPFFLYTVLFLSGYLMCSPSPLIQSARVTGRSGYSITMDTYPFDIKATLKEICDSCTVDENKVERKYLLDDSFMQLHKMFYRQGIADRVELRAFILPLPVYLLMYGNIKVALFDIGKDKLFRNVSSAVSLGGTYASRPEYYWKNGSYNAGMIVGTHQCFAVGDIEGVLTGHFSEYYHNDYFFLLKKKAEIRFVSLGCGVIIRPSHHNYLECTIGVVHNHLLDEGNTADGHLNTDPDGYANELKVDRFRMEPVVFQGGVTVYIPRKTH